MAAMAETDVYGMAPGGDCPSCKITDCEANKVEIWYAVMLCSTLLIFKANVIVYLRRLCSTLAARDRPRNFPRQEKWPSQ
jgi:hypothetical protein